MKSRKLKAYLMGFWLPLAVLFYLELQVIQAAGKIIFFLFLINAFPIL